MHQRLLFLGKEGCAIWCYSLCFCHTGQYLNWPVPVLASACMAGACIGWYLYWPVTNWPVPVLAGTCIGWYLYWPVPLLASTYIGQYLNWYTVCFSSLPLFLSFWLLVCSVLIFTVTVHFFQTVFLIIFRSLSCLNFVLTAAVSGLFSLTRDTKLWKNTSINSLVSKQFQPW